MPLSGQTKINPAALLHTTPLISDLQNSCYAIPQPPSIQQAPFFIQHPSSLIPHPSSSIVYRSSLNLYQLQKYHVYSRAAVALVASFYDLGV